MKEDFKKKVWIVVVALIIFIFVNPVHTLMEIEGSYQNIYLTNENIIESMRYYLTPGFFGNTVLPAVLAIVLGIAGFSYLFSKKKVDLYHSIPVKREKLFFASYINGILIYLGVYLMTLFLTTMTMTMQGLMNADSWKAVGGTFVGVTIHFLFFYHLTIIAVMLTGNMLVCAAAVMTLLFYGPMVCQMMDGFLSHYFVTYYADYVNGNSWLIMPLVSPVSSLIYFCAVSTGEKGNLGMNLLAAFLIAMILLVVAVILYKKRPSEVAGKALTNQYAESIIRILVVMPVALLGGLYIQNMSNGLSGIWFWFGFLFSGILCHVTMEIIYRFDFRAGFNHKLQLLGSLVVAAVFALCIQYDWTGYDTYLPDEGEIASAAVAFQNIDRDMNGYELVTDKTGAPSLSYVDKNTVALDEMYLTDIKDVLLLAQAGIEQLDYSDQSGIMPRAALFGRAMNYKNTRAQDDEEKNVYTIKYRLKNGREVIRSYRATLESTIDAMAKIYEQKEYKDTAFTLFKIKDSGVLTSVCGYNEWGDKILTAKDQEMKELLNIYTEELSKLTIAELQQELPVMRLDSMFMSDGYEDSVYGYYIYPSFTKTLQKLESLGVKKSDYDAQILPENIESISVTDYGYLATLDGEEENQTYNANAYYATENGSDDQAKIKELSSRLVLGNFLWTNSILHPVEQDIDFNIQFYRTSGTEKNGYANIRIGEVPAFVEQDLRESVEYY